MATPPALSQERTSPWAVASLVFGISVFVTGCIGGLPAVITGAVALCRKKDKPPLRGRGLAVAGICLGAFSLFWTSILAALALPAIHTALVRANQTLAATDAREVGMILHAVADDNSGIFPGTWEEIPLAQFGDEANRQRLLTQASTGAPRWILTPGLTTTSPAETVLFISTEDPSLKVLQGQITCTVDQQVHFNFKQKP